MVAYMQYSDNSIGIFLNTSNTISSTNAFSGMFITIIINEINIHW